MQSELSTTSRKLIIVNGPPASGKTTIAEGLVRELHLPLVSMDRIKEALFDTLGTGDREYNRQLSKASFAVIWSLLVDFPSDATVIVEGWFKHPPFDWVLAGLDKAGVSQFVEVWCFAPGEVLAERYSTRVETRHIGHPGIEYANELRDVARLAQPMSLSPVMRVDTNRPEFVDTVLIAQWIADQMPLSKA